MMSIIRPITNASSLIATRRRRSVDSRVFGWIAHNPYTAVLILGWSVMVAYLAVYIVSGGYRA